jgi:hypothetical protein
LIGRGPAVGIAVLLYLAFLPLSALPFYLGVRFALIPGVLVGVADVLVLAICGKSLGGDFRFARNASLVAFSLGMLGILVAAL